LRYFHGEIKVLRMRISSVRYPACEGRTKAKPKQKQKTSEADVEQKHWGRA
jgi:hypothetical protein